MSSDPNTEIGSDSESGRERLARQIAFIVEIDKAKQVLRQTWLMDGSRRENDAEHSWHLALMALVLAEHARARPQHRPRDSNDAGSRSGGN